MTSRKSTLLYTVVILLLGTGLTACGDNPVDHNGDDDDEHSEADGLRLVLNGVEVYRILEGQVSCQVEPCGITVAEGEETSLIRIDFLDADGDLIHDEDLDDEFSLGFEIADPAIAEFVQREEEGKWAFRVIGEQAGETEMQLQLLHLGEEDHEDFITPPLEDANALTIRVTED